jgi:hypothetical protein
MIVPKDSVGRLIGIIIIFFIFNRVFNYNLLGRSGCNIKQMCQVTGCKMVLSREQIFSLNNVPSHKISLSGSIEQILHAKVCF